ncbi:NlpC/P60 family protein [Lichenihabitans psoromatis]|uniref:NlpC/P60 family protein n=1 Tax=Lichenihabitans psoromatis TaxID=2528642 RepID=UPI001035990F|nr:NlpC/P60 family protein [Lichenihabitans psoromatis]
MLTRSDIVAAARRYIGTPYHHQGALAGAGCDCLGLVRGIWRDLYGAEPEQPPVYTPDWGEVGGDEHILAAAGRHMLARPVSEAEPGDVLVFRLRRGAIAKHIAVLSAASQPDGSGGRIIHAQSNDQVREVVLTPWWRRHAVAAFMFPGAQA